MKRRFVVWSGVDGWRAEVAGIDLTDSGVKATGTQIGIDPHPYRLEYKLEATENFVTRKLYVEAEGEGWRRRLKLVHDGQGTWSCLTQKRGELDLPDPGGEVTAVAGALDCDLGLSPVTNLMPVRRHDLHKGPGAYDFLMAWISVPGLGLHPSRQRYEHQRLTDGGAVVRYVGEHRDFVGDLEVDGDGLVIFYPALARRVRG
jgi:hypothetical protein